MILQRDNSPERISEHEALRGRMELVETSALGALASLYREFAGLWAGPEAQAPPAAASLQPDSAGSVIDRTFMESDLAARTSQLASNQAVNEAQRRVREAFDEFSA